MNVGRAVLSDGDHVVMIQAIAQRGLLELRFHVDHVAARQIAQGLMSAADLAETRLILPDTPTAKVQA